MKQDILKSGAQGRRKEKFEDEKFSGNPTQKRFILTCSLENGSEPEKVKPGLIKGKFGEIEFFRKVEKEF